MQVPQLVDSFPLWQHEIQLLAGWSDAVALNGFKTSIAHRSPALTAIAVPRSAIAVLSTEAVY
jgi:hypothetical protein